MFHKNKEIVSFEILTLRLSGMRNICEYEITEKAGKAEVTRYGIRFSEEGDRRVPEKRAVCDGGVILELLNDCKLLSWDGFYGPHPKGVTDGTMFRLNATVNDGKTVSANGSQNFPKHYHDLRDGLYDILEKYAVGIDESGTEKTDT